MNKIGLKKIWKWFKIVGIAYGMIGIALFFFQEKFIFHPQQLSVDYKYEFNIPFLEINLPVAIERNLSIIRFTVPDTIRKGIVLYFHGNRKNINHYAPFAPNFTRNGYEVWMIDYPGFGKTTGKRNEQVLYNDALTLYKMAISNISAEHIIIYGKSLGTGIAAQLASVRDCKRLLLETPYFSMDALAKYYFFMYPVLPMTKYSLPTNEYIEYINAPITIFHGTKDEIIPYQQAQRLTAIKKGIELITIDKGKHNNLADFPLYQHKLDSILTL